MLAQLKFNGQRIIVTGAGSGIGQACAEVLAELDAHVILVGKSSEHLEQTKAMLDRKSAKSEMHVVDISVESQVLALKQKLEGNPIKALINNAESRDTLGAIRHDDGPTRRHILAGQSGEDDPAGAGGGL